ncbi:uncharacterized protein LOC134804468 [Cydia splendana]|uniref:uncharacterized protein LOC134804468 n=1 Tax=Cydia splendana TaxID=1100963 RepID=UPI0028F48F50
MLLNFPCHVYSKRNIPTNLDPLAIGDNEVYSLPQVEAVVENIAGPSNSESFMSGQQLPSQAIPLKKLEAIPIADETQLNFSNNAYSNIVDKRNDNEVSLPQVEAIAGPSNSDSFMPGQQLPSQAMPLKKLEAIPITDETQLNFSNNAYSNIVDKRNDNEVSLPQVEAIAGPSNSGVSQTTVPGSAAQNGVAERANRTVMQAARCGSEQRILGGGR